MKFKRVIKFPDPTLLELSKTKTISKGGTRQTGTMKEEVV